MKRRVEAAAKKVEKAGMRVKTVVLEGDPKTGWSESLALGNHGVVTHIVPQPVSD